MMRHSTDRILTTHAGSLPRPRSLIALHTAKFAGTPIEDTALEQAAEQASRAVIARQIESGIDIVNNGEMGRESFFTYVQHRMTGFGGTGTRPIMADLTRYPGSLERRRQAMGSDERVDLLKAPKAIGEVRYVNVAPIEQECRQLQDLLGEVPGTFSEGFVSAPSPGIIAAGMQNDY
jgi:5-methyltetrahydropteroyltriglutamate--homocysteine methyltransferase